MHIVAKIALSTLIPRMINELYTLISKNKDRLVKIPAKKIRARLRRKTELEQVLYIISKAEYISINIVVYHIDGFVNNKKEKLLYLSDGLTYNLQIPDDLNAIKQATFYKLKKV